MTLFRDLQEREQPKPLQLKLEYDRLSASQLSNVLWSLQATLRTAGLENVETSQQFLAIGPPVLVIDSVETGNSIDLDFLFSDKFRQDVLSSLSTHVFLYFCRRTRGIIKKCVNE